MGSSLLLTAWGCGGSGEGGGSGSDGGSIQPGADRYQQAHEACQGMLALPCAHGLTACVELFMRDAELPDYNFCSAEYDAYLACVKAKPWYCDESQGVPATPAPECDVVHAQVDACLAARPCVAGIPIGYLCNVECSGYSVNCSLISTAEFECRCLGGAHDGAKYKIDDCKELYYADVGPCAG